MNPERSIQKEIYHKHPMLGIETGLPADGLQTGPPVPGWVREGPVYEVFIRNFSREGTFGGLEKKCAWLRELGIKTIWLMPIQPIGFDGRKGRLGSPYAISDHREINPEYGTKKDFKHLVDAIHDHDMRIIIDMVLNHTARDHIMLAEHADNFNKSFLHTPAEWSDIRELNYDRALTREYALESMIYWVKEFGIDGYRCDVAGLVPKNFWEMALKRLLDINSDIYMLAEWDNRALHNKAFHSNYDWTAYQLMREVLAGQYPASDLTAWCDEQKSTYPANILPLRFTENHDLPRTVETFGQQKFMPFAAFCLLSAGLPLIYNGQEIGATQQISLFDKQEIEWHDRDEETEQFYRKIIQIRNSNISFFRSTRVDLWNDAPKNIISYTAENRSDLIFVYNFSNNDGPVKIMIPETGANVKFTDLISDSVVNVVHGNVETGPWQVRVLKKLN